MEHDEPLDEETFDIAATRPELLLGLPYSLMVAIIIGGVMFVSFYSTGHMIKDLAADVVVIGGLLMLRSAAKIILRSDYHGWDILIAWCRLDARLLDTAANGGAMLTSLPVQSVYRCAVFEHA